MGFIVHCRQCQSEFKTTAYRASVGKGKYCSKRCFDLFQKGRALPEKWTGIFKKCPTCGKQFYSRPSQAHKFKHCSKACALKSVEIACGFCGKLKRVFPFRIKDGRGKFCSMTCYNAHKKSPAHKAKLANWFKSSADRSVRLRGTKLTPGARLKISQGIKKAYANGAAHGFTGKHHTAEEKERRSKMKLGVPLLSARGQNSSNWKGGVTPINHKIRTSLEYKMWRRMVFRRDHYTCQICGKKGGNIQADHIKPFSLFPSLRLDVSNGRTLCEPCHKNTFTYMHRHLTMEVWLEHERVSL